MGASCEERLVSLLRHGSVFLVTCFHLLDLFNQPTRWAQVRCYPSMRQKHVEYASTTTTRKISSVHVCVLVDLHTCIENAWITGDQWIRMVELSSSAMFVSLNSSLNQWLMIQQLTREDCYGFVYWSAAMWSPFSSFCKASSLEWRFSYKGQTRTRMNWEISILLRWTLSVFITWAVSSFSSLCSDFSAWLAFAVEWQETVSMLATAIVRVINVIVLVYSVTIVVEAEIAMQEEVVVVKVPLWSCWLLWWSLRSSACLSESFWVAWSYKRLSNDTQTDYGWSKRQRNTLSKIFKAKEMNYWEDQLALLRINTRYKTTLTLLIAWKCHRHRSNYQQLRWRQNNDRLDHRFLHICMVPFPK